MRTAIKEPIQEHKTMQVKSLELYQEGGFFLYRTKARFFLTWYQLNTETLRSSPTNRARFQASASETKNHGMHLMNHGDNYNSAKRTLKQLNPRTWRTLRHRIASCSILAADKELTQQEHRSSWREPWAKIRSPCLSASESPLRGPGTVSAGDRDVG